ncbi:PREDICTED: cation/H(+) antiporter 6A-like isoform X2 [Tarenaya hassleriana]|nr:PREDICTED: cation/H(+) antiporter 6A-like isoform X2 [Tarenaya hassleriana]
MDAETFTRMGKKSTLIGFTTMAVPLFFGSILFIIRERTGKMRLTVLEYRAIVFMNSVSPFTSIDTLLRDLKINHSEFGRIALSSAMVTDLVAFVVHFLFVLLWGKALGILQTVAACVFFASMFFFVKPAMFWVIRQTPEGRPVKDFYIYAILLLAFLSFHYWHQLGEFGPAGSFVFGWAIPDGPPLGSALVHRFESFNLGIILPLFGSLTAMQVDLQWLIGEIKNFTHMEGRVYEAISMILLLSATKFITSIIVAFATRMPLRDSIILALALSNKGFFELAFFTSSVELKVLHPEIFTISATAILLNSLFIPFAIELLHDPSKKFRSYGRRNLVNLKDDSELQTLVCIHKPDHITSMINLLEAFQPSQHSPVACYVLHLIELVGRATPNFISHQVQKPAVGSQSCSDNVIASFKCFNQKFSDSTSLYMFTSLSIAKHMHEDICWLALAKSLSLILLPFHRTWSVDRSAIVSDDVTMRNVNRNILRRAPCSVGILVYRKPIWNPQMTDSHCKVCLIFVGGKDDMEALALANRMRRMNKEISLTFLRFIPESSLSESMGNMQDLMDRKEIMEMNIDGSKVGNNHPVTYIDREVSDGLETSVILRSMAHGYDLFIVGRSSGGDCVVTRGISEWTEFEELGTVGDLLASKDFPTRASVLVVQHQDFTDDRY